MMTEQNFRRSVIAGSGLLLVLVALNVSAGDKSEATKSIVNFDAMARHAYQQMDADHNGLLTVVEHRSAGKLEGDFLAADKNDNASLSVEEYIAWEATKHGMVNTADAGLIGSELYAGK